MKFREFLLESMLEIYHGNDHSTKMLVPKLMNNGNNQHGIGIYFTNNKSTAESYGKHVVKINVNTSKLINNKDFISVIGKNKILKILKILSSDKEGMYILTSNYGIEIFDSKDLKTTHVEELVHLMLDEEVRNFQITLAEEFGVEKFVNAWNKITNIDGTYEKRGPGEIWYAIINTKYKVSV